MGKYYILRRTFSGKLVISNLGDIFEIYSIIIGNTGHYNSTQVLNNLHDKVTQQNKWIVYLIHDM